MKAAKRASQIKGFMRFSFFKEVLGLYGSPLRPTRSPAARPISAIRSGRIIPAASTASAHRKRSAPVPGRSNKARQAGVRFAGARDPLAIAASGDGRAPFQAAHCGLDHDLETGTMNVHRNMKTKRHLLQLCLLWAMLLPARLHAQFIYLTNNGAITITGCTASGGWLTIPSTINGWPVTSIGDAAFSGSGVQKITLSPGVTSIGNSAFEGCLIMDTVFSPNSVTSIGSNAFNLCYLLSGVTLPAGLTNLGTRAFFYCTSLDRNFGRDGKR